MAADRTGRVWDEVRRALGRLVGRVSSHSLPEAQAGIVATVRHSEATQFSSAEPGARQDEWQWFAQVRDLPALTAPPGGGGVDPSSVVMVIGVDQTLGASTVDVSEAACQFGSVSVRAWTLECDMPVAQEAQETAVRFEDVAARRAEMIFGAPTVRPIPVVRSALPKRKPESPPEWPIKAVRVQTGLASILRVPILCHRLIGPSGGGAFAAERRLLAAAAAAPEADVALIGVFPHVPLSAVQKLSVVPDGTALQVWVRPDAVGCGAATVTVVLGRQRSTGKMLQTVSRAPAKN